MRQVARATAILSVLGASLGVALDAMHVLSGTTRYTPPSVLVVAWWTFPLFASAAVALGLAPIAIERALGLAGVAPSARAAAIAMGLFVLAYLISCVVHGAAGAVALLAIAALAWWVADRRAIGVAHALGAAIAGPLVEIALVRAGLFAHAGGELLGVPIWLPCLYLCASIGVGALARSLVAGPRPVTA